MGYAIKGGSGGGGGSSVPVTGSTGEVMIASGTNQLPTYNYDPITATLTIGSGKYRLYPNSDFTGTIKEYTITGGSFVLANNLESYVVAQYNDGVPNIAVITDKNLVNDSNVIGIYTCSRIGNLSSGFSILNWGTEGIGLANKLNEKGLILNRFTIANGITLSSTPTQLVNISSGRIFLGSNNISYNSLVSNVNECFVRTYNGNGTWTRTVATSWEQKYDKTDGSGLIALSTSNYTCVWVWRDCGADRIHLVYSPTQTAVLATAQGYKTPSNIDALLTGDAVFIGRMIIQQGQTVPIQIDQYTVGNFSSSGNTTYHNGLNGLTGGYSGVYDHLPMYDGTTPVLVVDKVNEYVLTGGNKNAFVQLNCQNTNSGNAASSDIVATSDIGTNTTHFVDMGINSSTYNNPLFTVAGAGDAYIYASDDNLSLGVVGAGKNLKIHAGGTTLADVVETIDSSGVKFNSTGAIPVMTINKTSNIVAVNTSDIDGTPATGALTVKGSTNNGSTNIFVGRDSDETNVFSVDTDGKITTPVIKPTSNSTTAVQITKSDGLTSVVNVDTTNSIVAINTIDIDGTPPIGKLVVKGSTTDNTSNIMVGRDSSETNTFVVNCDGGIDGHMNTYHLTKDPTGFVDPDNIGMAYDKINRTMTLTHSSGFIVYLFQGIKYTLISPWTSVAHTAGTVSYYLTSIDGANIIWSLTPPEYSNLIIGTARYAPATSEYYGIRECHGLMPWQDHQEFHEQIGTYRVSGLDIDVASILINPANGSATNAGNRPTTNSGVIKDEDVSTTIPQWLDTGVYSTLYFDASGNPIINTSNSDIYVHTSNVLQYNLIGTGLQPISNTNYINLWCYHVPTTSDVSSQKYRNMWLIGQQQHTSLANAQSEDPRGNSFGLITGQIGEQVPYAVITMQYNTAISSANVNGRCKIASAVRYLSGSRMSLINGTVASVSHNSTINRDDVGNHTKLAPLTDSTSGLQVTKADGTTVILDVDTINNSVGIGTATPSINTILDLTSTTKGFTTPRMTKAQRLAMTAIEGLEVYQTDNGIGKYCYTNGIWEQISGKGRLYGLKTSNQTGVTTGTDISFQSYTGNIANTATTFTLLAGKTYKMLFSTRVDFTSNTDAAFAFVDSSNVDLPLSSHGDLGAFTISTNVALNPTTSGMITPSSDMVVKVRCIFAGTSCTLNVDQTFLIVEQIY